MNFFPNSKMIFKHESTPLHMLFLRSEGITLYVKAQKLLKEIKY